MNLVTEKHAEGLVYVSTYPTMMGLIDEASDGQRRFGIGHFDLFDIEAGVPTDAYSLEEAVRDGFLVPPKAVSVPLTFLTPWGPGTIG